MELNEIKKQLYKDKPKASFVHARKEGLLYSCECRTPEVNEKGLSVWKNIFFQVPIIELGETAFIDEMPAQLLIRYIIEEPTY